jgi:hypothetical protein
MSHSLSAEEIYVLEDGDGDPNFMHMRHEVRMARETWFPGHILGEPAILFIIVGTAHKGQYVALRSRWTQSIEDQMLTNGFASVSVDVIGNPTPTFGTNYPTEDRIGGGMTVLRRSGDRRFEPSES